MTHRGSYLSKIVAFAVASLAFGSASASTFLGEVPIGTSDNLFQISQGTSLLVVNINATGVRDPTLCDSCNSGYTDDFTVNLFNQTGTLLTSATDTNFFFSNNFTSSHGQGAGPVFFSVPANATSLEIVSQLFIMGLQGADGNPLSFGNLSVSTDGSIAATPIPSTLPLLATGLAALGIAGWRRKRKPQSISAT